MWELLLLMCAAGAEKLDDGCGHSVLSLESGVLTSKNYPGTYPNNSWCEWKIRVQGSAGIILKFGDLDVEGDGCESSYVKILQTSHEESHDDGTFCGRHKVPFPEVLVHSSEVMVQFHSGQHISGRGFLLSYAAAKHKDLLTCLDMGSHISAPKYRKYCPAGCKAVAGEVSGDISQGYRHTSPLCKAAIHAGVILDEFGGLISVEKLKGLSHYPGTKANGVESQVGSLSDTLFTFDGYACEKRTVLQPALVNSRPPDAGIVWHTDRQDQQQWLQLDLGEEKRVTDIVTQGCRQQEPGYVKTYRVEYKERSSWRVYAHANSSLDRVFEGNTDSFQKTRNTFQPPIMARYLRIVPLTWHLRISMTVELLGCMSNKANWSAPESLAPKDRHPAGPYEEEETSEPVASQAELERLIIIVVATVLCVVLVLAAVCFCKGTHRKKAKGHKSCPLDDQKTGCWGNFKQPFARHPSTEFTISYSPEKDPMQKLDLVTSSMAVDYQQPPMIGMGTVIRKGSTFRPMDTEAKEASDGSTHYNYLHTANQYALPLTNQEPEYATPIIERHTFRKDAFMPDPSYSVPGIVLSKTPSFRSHDIAGGFVGNYQTPQVKGEQRHVREGGYDKPKAKPSPVGNGVGTDYQSPQAKPVETERWDTGDVSALQKLLQPGNTGGANS